MIYSEKKHRYELKRKERRKRKRLHEARQGKTVSLFPIGNGHPYNKKTNYGILSFTKKWMKKQISGVTAND